MTISPVEPAVGSAPTNAVAAPTGVPRGPPLPFSAYYAYSPSGGDPTSRRSRRICAAIKTGNRRWIANIAAELRAYFAERPDWARSFGLRAVLVPVPASGPRDAAVGEVAEAIAAALVHAGLGATVRPMLVRRHAVRKSATSPVGSRPSVAEHFASLAIADRDPAGAVAEFVLIDDVVTRGRTMLAAACRLRAAYPQAEVRAFALMRTLGFVAGVARLVDPCLGEIRWRRGDACRIP